MSDSHEVRLYDRLGGDAGIRRLVESFYRHMDTVDGARELRAMHAPDLATAIDKLHLFLSGWSGGPALYVEKYGHPMLRARHLPFPIDKNARDQWLRCMLLAIEEQGIADPLRQELMESFMRVADHMRNREG
jgi:hemoglobin